MALLMTPTLWNSVDWLEKCPPSWKKSAYQQLLDMLNRKWTGSKAIERGMAFEKAICEKSTDKLEIADDINEKFSNAYNLIHREGGQFQAKAKKFVEYDNKEFVLYGKMDVYFAGTEIDDIKTTGNYKGKDAYLKTWQHKIYCLATRVNFFRYIVFEFNDFGILVDVHIIEHTFDDFVALEKEVMEKLDSIIKLIRNDEKLKKAYLNKFNMYN